MRLLEGLQQRLGGGSLADFAPGGITEDFAPPGAGIVTPYIVIEDGGSTGDTTSQAGQGPTDQKITFTVVGEDGDKAMAAAYEIIRQLDDDPIVPLSDGAEGYADVDGEPKFLTEPELAIRAVDMFQVSVNYNFQM
jgi:hypothetical protein